MGEGEFKVEWANRESKGQTQELVIKADVLRVIVAGHEINIRAPHPCFGDGNRVGISASFKRSELVEDGIECWLEATQPRVDKA